MPLGTHTIKAKYWLNFLILNHAFYYNKIHLLYLDFTQAISRLTVARSILRSIWLLGWVQIAWDLILSELSMDLKQFQWILTHQQPTSGYRRALEWIFVGLDMQSH